MRRLLALALVAACGGAAGDGPDAGPLLDAGTGDYHVDRAGYVNLIEGGAFLSVFATITDQPERPVATAIAADGDCVVYQRPAPSLCTPACDGVCEAGACHPWPVTLDVGRITVGGLKQPLAFVRGEFGYQPEPAPGADLFDDGDPITIDAPGAAVPGFAVELHGVADLTGAPSSLTLVAGQPTEVTWTAAGSGRIQVALLVGWHGAPWEAMLLCETADDGALTIPAALVTALPRASTGLESHPSTITRFERKSVTGPHGPIEFVVGSQQLVSLSR